jgi:CheY-like chemotaxis protein
VKESQTIPQTLLSTPATPTASARPLRVLLVEDHAPVRKAMCKLIRAAGADVVTARDGEEGLGYLLSQRFDVLLTDLQMPVMDGLELLHQCQSLPDTHRPSRIIAISGEYEAGILRGQPVQFLPKPLNLESLLGMLGGKPN